MLFAQILKSVGKVSKAAFKAEKELAAHIRGLHGSGYSIERRNFTCVLSDVVTVGTTKLA